MKKIGKILVSMVIVLLLASCNKSSDENNSSWVVQEPVSSNWLQSVVFNGAAEGWIVGWNNTILHTIDGGLSWEEKSINSMSSFHFYDIAFADSHNGCIVGQSNSEPVGGVIFATDNGGLTWSEVNIESDIQVIRSVSFADANNGWAVGGDGVILHTTNGGKSWTEQASGTTASLYDVFASDIGSVWACGAGGTVLYSADGGQSWIDKNIADSWINSIYFLDSDNGWAVTAGGDSKIYSTTDGGQNWTLRYTGDTEYFNDIVFSSNKKGWVCGESGVVYATNDGGQSWIKNNLPSAAEINAMFFVSDNNAWAVGYDGYMAHLK